MPFRFRCEEITYREERVHLAGSQETVIPRCDIRFVCDDNGAVLTLTGLPTWVERMFKIGHRYTPVFQDSTSGDEVVEVLEQVR